MNLSKDQTQSNVAMHKVGTCEAHDLWAEHLDVVSLCHGRLVIEGPLGRSVEVEL